MASLHSLPEHLVGVLYSLLPDRESRRAFLSCSSAVRRAPSVLSQITELSISAKELEQCHSVNPLACLPKGVRLQSLQLEFSKDSPSLAEMFNPKEESTRARVQGTLSILQMLSISDVRFMGCPPLKEPHTVGSCLAQLPHLKRLKLLEVPPDDVLALLQTMAGPAVRPLESFSYRPPLSQATQNANHNVIIAALAPFQNLAAVQFLQFPGSDYSPLGQLPKLRELDLQGWGAFDFGILCAVLPHLPALKVCRVHRLSPSGAFSVPDLVSASLEHLALSYVKSIGQIARIMDSAAGGLLPCLRKVEVGELNTSDVFEMGDACNLGNTLAAQCARVPLLCFQVDLLKILAPYVFDDLSTPTSFDALAELLCRAPALGQGIQQLSILTSLNQPATRLKELPSLVPNLKGLIWRGEAAEDLPGLVPTVESVSSLQSIRVEVLGDACPPGIAGGVLALCVPCACLERVQDVNIHVVCDIVVFSEHWVKDACVNRELRLLGVLWPQTRRVLRSCGCPCRVTLDISDDCETLF